MYFTDEDKRMSRIIVTQWPVYSSKVITIFFLLPQRERERERERTKAQTIEN